MVPRAGFFLSTASLFLACRFYSHGPKIVASLSRNKRGRSTRKKHFLLTFFSEREEKLNSGTSPWNSWVAWHPDLQRSLGSCEFENHMLMCLYVCARVCVCACTHICVEENLTENLRGCTGDGR